MYFLNRKNWNSLFRRWPWCTYSHSVPFRRLTSWGLTPCPGSSTLRDYSIIYKTLEASQQPKTRSTTFSYHLLHTNGKIRYWQFLAHYSAIKIIIPAHKFWDIRALNAIKQCIHCTLTITLLRLTQKRQHLHSLYRTAYLRQSILHCEVTYNMQLKWLKILKLKS